MGEAMDYWKNNKKEANEIMAKGLSIDVAEFEATETGLKFFSKEDNDNLFGLDGEKGSIYKSTENTIQFYKDQKLIENDVKAEDVMDSSFLK